MDRRDREHSSWTGAGVAVKLPPEHRDLLRRSGIALALTSVTLVRLGRLPRRLTSTASRLSTILVRFPLLSLVIVLIAAFSSHRATAQTTPAAPWIVQELWAFKDGAPESPTALAQTADGYLWVGASAGLFRFDGTRFELFRAASGEPLQSTFVSALSAADDGLWVGYGFGGVRFLKNGKVTNFDESTSSVTGFAQDKQGITWASSNRPGGLWRFDGSSWQRIGAEVELSIPEPNAYSRASVQTDAGVMAN